MKHVLFACVHNAGRSQMAAAWFNALADSSKVRGISAGTAPGARVHPEVLTAMQEVGIDLSDARPQFLSDELAQTASLLITMGCGEACPAVPGLRRDDWPLEDPKGKPLARVREIRDEVRSRIADLVAREGWARTPMSPPEVSLRPARPDDLDAIRAFVAAAGLPTADIAEQFPDAYVMLEADEGVIGTAGLEVHGEAGLLRSVAVASSYRHMGLGRMLTEDRLAAARSQSLSGVYLLTTTAPEYFARLGFQRIARESAPEALHRCSEFAAVCPASAICLVQHLATSGAGLATASPRR